MRLSEVAEIIGKDKIDEFREFMCGQTVGIYPDGKMDYYEQDVDNFLRDKKDRFFD